MFGGQCITTDTDCQKHDTHIAVGVAVDNPFCGFSKSITRCTRTQKNGCQILQTPIVPPDCIRDDTSMVGINFVDLKMIFLGNLTYKTDIEAKQVDPKTARLV
jgi:hypothetical protein